MSWDGGEGVVPVKLAHHDLSSEPSLPSHPAFIPIDYLCTHAHVFQRAKAGLSGLPLSIADYSHGFGGRYGVEKDKRDKAALGYDYKGETEKHESQRGK